MSLPHSSVQLCRRNRGHQRPKQVPTVLCQPSSSSSFLLDSGSMHHSNTAIAVAIVAVTMPSPLQTELTDFGNWDVRWGYGKKVQCRDELP
ncbi:hypothetical protein F0562_031931 [Nyssa sinensis]|uniref:Uncharacterized protein n=1 Tax=Nyssa sinensis TaxID=561372 RepID=A0A5J5AVP9_9ASTE|nr:hypothetical protein F0562_031931 [Nyssa sinensis]